jgi:hypothetical protein
LLKTLNFRNAGLFEVQCEIMKRTTLRVSRLLVFSSFVFACGLAILIGSRGRSPKKTFEVREGPAVDSVPVSTALPNSEQHSFHWRRPPTVLHREDENNGIALALPTSPEHSQDLDNNREWARNNPTAALNWALKAEEGAQREAVVETVCPQLAQTDPAQAVDLAERSGPSCSNLLENMTLLWAQRDERSAYEWAANKPLGEERDRLLGRIAFAESASNPKEAARLVAEEISPGTAQEEAAVSVVYQWAQLDSNAAKAWAQSFPPGTLRDRAISEVENVVTGGT